MGAQVSAQPLVASASSAFTISVSWWEMEDWDEDPVSPVSGKTGEVLSLFFSLPMTSQKLTRSPDPFPFFPSPVFLSSLGFLRRWMYDGFRL